MQIEIISLCRQYKRKLYTYFVFVSCFHGFRLTNQNIRLTNQKETHYIINIIYYGSDLMKTIFANDQN